MYANSENDITFNISAEFTVSSGNVIKGTADAFSLTILKTKQSYSSIDDVNCATGSTDSIALKLTTSSGQNIIANQETESGFAEILITIIENSNGGTNGYFKACL